MTRRLCRCGQIVDGRCTTCNPGRTVTQRTTCERGYDKTWQRNSERYRKVVPLCQVCESHGIVTPSSQVHHIVKALESEELRNDWDNMLGVCDDCHKWIENKPDEARRIKRLSDAGSDGPQRW